MSPAASRREGNNKPPANKLPGMKRFMKRAGKLIAHPLATPCPETSSSTGVGNRATTS